MTLLFPPPPPALTSVIFWSSRPAHRVGRKVSGFGEPEMSPWSWWRPKSELKECKTLIFFFFPFLNFTSSVPRDTNPDPNPDVCKYKQLQPQKMGSEFLSSVAPKQQKNVISGLKIKKKSLSYSSWNNSWNISVSHSTSFNWIHRILMFTFVDRVKCKWVYGEIQDAVRV